MDGYTGPYPPITTPLELMLYLYDRVISLVTLNSLEEITILTHTIGLETYSPTLSFSLSPLSLSPRAATRSAASHVLSATWRSAHRDPPVSGPNDGSFSTEKKRRPEHLDVRSIVFVTGFQLDGTHPDRRSQLIGVVNLETNHKWVTSRTQKSGLKLAEADDGHQIHQKRPAKTCRD